MKILFSDNRILVCVKPFGVESTDVEGGLPSLLRRELNEPQGCVRTVHRLDRPVGGVMVLARSKMAASLLSDQVRSHTFKKTYLAVVHGTPEKSGTFSDLLLRNKAERKTYVTDTTGKDVQSAVLHYQTLETNQSFSLVRIELETGRTHQIRAQFSAHGFPIVGDKKYGAPPMRENEIALWSFSIYLNHPQTGEAMCFSCNPPQGEPWSLFDCLQAKQ